MKRRLERALELARLCDKPVALQHAVVHGGERIGIGREGLVKRMKRGGAIGLMAIGLQQRVVLAVGQRHLLAVVQGDHRMLDVGVGEHRVHVVRDVAEAARERQQVLALFVEHVFLLVIGAFDRKAVDRQLGVLAASSPGRSASGIRSSSGVNQDRASAAFAKRIWTFCRRAFALLSR